MTPESAHSATVAATASAPAERRQAVWPWLLLPLVVLAVFFVLKTAKDQPSADSSPNAAVSADPARGDDSASSEDVESR